MTKPFKDWTVLPHGKLTHIDDRMLTVTGRLHMPVADVERRMTTVRLADGRLVVYSAIALDDAQMADVETFGTPAFLIVPSDLHRMDVKIWKDRYPTARVIAPAGARAKVEEVIPVDDTSADLDDPSVRLVTVPGTGDGELALVVEGDEGTTLVVNDVIFNFRPPRGVRGWLFKAIGMAAAQPIVPRIVQMRLVKDKAALRDQFERWAHLPNLKRIVVSHGDVIADDAPAVLGRLAQDLAA